MKHVLESIKMKEKTLLTFGQMIQRKVAKEEK
jgi:hypothetical protein